MITLAASSIGTIILIVLLISLFGGGFWGYRAGWGPWPVGGLSGLLILLIVLWAIGVLGCSLQYSTDGKNKSFGVQPLQASEYKALKELSRR